MKRDRYLLIGVAALVIAVFVFAARFYKQSERAERDEAIHQGVELVRPDNMAIGNPGAPVTVVEFLDPECESCRAFHPVVKAVIGEFGPEKVRLVIRYMPFHENSVRAATLLEAARDQAKYVEYLELMLLRQPEWGSHEAPRPELLVDLAKELKLDVDKLEARANSSEIRNRVFRDFEDGKKLGVRQTPSFFVNGTMLENLGEEPLRKAISEALDRGPAAI